MLTDALCIVWISWYFRQVSTLRFILLIISQTQFQFPPKFCLSFAPYHLPMFIDLSMLPNTELLESLLVCLCHSYYLKCKMLQLLSVGYLVCVFKVIHTELEGHTTSQQALQDYLLYSLSAILPCLRRRISHATLAQEILRELWGVNAVSGLFQVLTLMWTILAQQRQWHYSDMGWN